MPDPSLIDRAFGPERAEVYDDQFAALQAMKEAMHLVLRVQLDRLPEDARILVAGAGTGAEVRMLAPLHPGWRFTLVDPAPAMLAIARRHAEAGGYADRCTFHEGYLDTAPDHPHDAAISVLVSHFLTDLDERRAYFEQVAARLAPGAPLFDADLCHELEGPAFASVMDLWLGLLALAGDIDRAAYRGMYGTMVGAHGPAEVEGVLAEAGFEGIATCFQMALVRAWVATRAG